MADLEQDTPFVSPYDLPIIEQRQAQRSTIGDVAAGFEQTALKHGADRAASEGQAALDTFNTENPEQVGAGFSSTGRPGMTTGQMGAALGGIGRGLTGRSAGPTTEWDRAEHSAELLEDIPPAYHNEILSETSIESATRERARIISAMTEQRRNALSMDGGVANLVGSLIDVDLPLNLGTGGMIGAAAIARRTSWLSRPRVTGVIQGVAGGAQAGAIVGAYDAAVEATADETSFVASVIGGAALGGAFGAMGGDLTQSLNDLERDYATRVATGDKSLAATIDIVEPTAAPTPLTAGEGSSVGAQQVTPNVGVPARNLDLSDASPDQMDIITRSENENHEGGFNDRKEEQTGFLDQMAASSWNSGVGAGFQARMYTSNSQVMNWLGNTVFESASGINRGRATSAAMLEMYHKRIQTPLLPVRRAMNGWAARNNASLFGTGRGISEAGQARFNRAVMLERNARQHGHTRTTDADIEAASNSYDNTSTESLNIGKGRADQQSVLGLEDVKANPHYTPIKWVGKKITRLLEEGRVSRKAIVSALERSYRAAGMSNAKDAAAVAHAVIRRAELNDMDMDSSMHALLQADGKDFLRDTLTTSGLSEVEVDGIMNRLTGAAEDRSKEGFAKSRNDIDMSIQIETLDGGDPIQIVDLLSHDLENDWMRYTRGMAGSAALARVGITSKAKRKDVISAIHAEQRATGEELTPTDELTAMFTEFDAGATKGWSALGAGEPSAAGPGVSFAKRAVQLAWLNKLGLTQLGETGAMLAQNGMASWLKRGPLAHLDAELKAGNTRLLNELSYILGEIGQDQHLFAQHRNFDDVNASDELGYLGKVNNAMSTASFVQGYTSLFNTVRSSQQKTAALGVMDKVMRTLRDAGQAGEELTPNQKARMWSDLGLDAETLNRLDGMIHSGVIEFSPEGFVNRLNVDQWDPDLQDIVGASITRNINQVVQKSMAGEQDSWMSTGMGSILTHLKTFPMQATHKQFIRHFRHNDPEAYGAVMATFGTALIASLLRAAIDGKSGEMTATDHAGRAFGYSNMTGFLPMAYDPLATMMGLEDYRINQFGTHSEISPPVLSYMNDAFRVPGAVVHAATGNAEWDDEKALRTLPFANAFLFGEMMTSIGQAQD